jgi:hypothetical protein
VVTAHDQNNAQPRDGVGGCEPAAGHHALIAQPHTEAEGPIAAAEAVAARISTAEYPLGRPGRPLNGRSPFLMGMSATAGAAVTVGLIAMIITARSVLVLIGLSLFLAIGLEPAVSVLTRRWLPRWAAVLTVMVSTARES